jgi:hypothetical protein
MRKGIIRQLLLLSDRGPDRHNCSLPTSLSFKDRPFMATELNAIHSSGASFRHGWFSRRAAWIVAGLLAVAAGTALVWPVVERLQDSAGRMK